MQIVFGSSIFFIWRYSEARWLLISTAGSVIAALIWGGLRGFGSEWALFHIVFYTPFLIYLYRRRDALPESRLYRIWLIAASATMGISLGFDWWDLLRHLFFVS